MPTLLLDTLLALFPPRTHALTLAVDPAGWLELPELAAALGAAGFRTLAAGGPLAAGDPLLLRLAWGDAQPVTPAAPLIVRTAGAANALPYDLWQQGVVADLSPARHLPQIDCTLLRGMSLAQLERVYAALQAQPAAAALGRAQSLDYLLLHAFGAAPAALGAPGPLLRWLAELYGHGETLPPALAAALLPHLQASPPLAAWPLDALLAGRDTFKAFAQEQWDACIRQIGERPAPYTALIPFATDRAVQAALPALLRSGLLAAVSVAERASFPSWSQAALHEDAALAGRQRWDAAVAGVEQRLAAHPAYWADWQALAAAWADLTRLRYAPGGPADEAGTGRYASLAGRLAPLYTAWLEANYARLANRRLPAPHHLHHLPHLLDLTVAGGGRVALIVLDGMSLAAWRTIREAWSARHPQWRLHETLVLAQVPTITAVSRQALLAGEPPRAFAASLHHNQQEETHWRRFWQGRGLPADAAAYAAVSPREARPLPTALDSRRTRALAVVLPDVDTLLHGSSEGLASFYAGLRVWLDPGQAPDGSRWVEALIDSLLAGGYAVTLTSDHGHVEAVGIGTPQEGVAVATRSKRARIYHNELAARGVQAAFGPSSLWHHDGLLPDNTWVLLPGQGVAFAAVGQRVVSHGGLTVDETIVPVIKIEQAHE